MSVYKAINLVQADLNAIGISKDRKNEKQGFVFRGIDDVYNAVAPLLAKHGLCILPNVLERSCTDRTSANEKVLIYTVVRMSFDFVCAEDGSKHTISTYGEAMDSGDKSTNKAMSAAYKYALMQAFSIPTKGDNDADLKTHEIAYTEAQEAALRDLRAAAMAGTATLKPAWEMTPPDVRKALRDELPALKAAAAEADAA